MKNNINWTAVALWFESDGNFSSLKAIIQHIVDATVAFRVGLVTEENRQVVAANKDLQLALEKSRYKAYQLQMDVDQRDAELAVVHGRYAQIQILHTNAVDAAIQGKNALQAYERLIKNAGLLFGTGKAAIDVIDAATAPGKR